MKKLLLLALCLEFVFTSCKYSPVSPERAFYYWKSNYNLKPADVSYLKDVGVTKLYLHFFDVAWSEPSQRPYPVDELRFTTAPDNHTFSYVPVVFIPNNTLEKLSIDSIDELCAHIYDQVFYMAAENKLQYKELQFDCDWTEKSRNKYFKLLNYFHNHLKDSGKIVSATIRLHQVKYPDVTGIPPIDRGMLMFYNMGKVNGTPGYNSIYNSKDADKYASYIKAYTLPLDLALPVFSWAICERDGQVNGIMEKTTAKDFPDSMFTQSTNGIFVSRRSQLLHGKYFMKNDTVKPEQVSAGLCMDAAQNAYQYLPNTKRTLSLFEYDSLYLSTYDKKDIAQIFSVSH